MRRSLLVVSLLLVLVLLGGQAFADLNGANVTVNYLYPDINTIYETLGTGTVTSGGFTVNSFGEHDFTTYPTDLTLTNVLGSDVFFLTASFNGYQLVVNSGGSPITGVTIAFNDIAGFDASRISFDATDVWVNLQSLTTTWPRSATESAVRHGSRAKHDRSTGEWNSRVFWRCKTQAVAVTLVENPLPDLNSRFGHKLVYGVMVTS